MRWEKTACIVFIVGLSLSSFAQVPVRPVPVPAPAAKPRVEPCWQVAGISKATMQQRNMIARETHQQVEAICANSALSPQQKQQEIKQIREREKQQTEGLITPEQQSALRACQRERNPNPPPHVAHAPTGPCGEMPTVHPATGADDQKPPDDESKPN